MKIRFIAVSAACATILSGCGGGGGSASSPSGTAGNTTYTASAAAGELITYTLNTTDLTYSYQITESAWGLKGQTGSGTLVRNGDGTYTPSEASNTRLVIGNGILLGAVRKVVGSSSHTFPFIGTTGQISTISELAGTYNYLHRVCTTVSTCTAYHGTLRVDPSGAWSSCRGGNLSATTPACAVTGSGNLTALGNGRFQINGSSAQMWGVKIGTSKLVVADYYTSNAGQSLVATEQASHSSGSGDGDWFVVSPTERLAGKMTISGTNVSMLRRDMISFGGEMPSTNLTNSFTANTPWSGLVATSNGVGIVSGNTSLYGYVIPASGYFEFGIKMQ
jgi:hypothetical protein